MLKAPLLMHFGIPLKTKVLSVCLKEIVSLSEMFPNENIMNVTYYNGKQSKVIAIPVCSSRQTFMNMNRKSGFLDNLPNDIRGERNKELTNEQVVHWIIELL